MGMEGLDEIRRLAFVEHGRKALRLTTEGPLADLSFAAKDLIDIAAYKSAWGNPDRLRDAQPALATAPAALVPLMAGAELVGKTQTDEVACGMFGMNPHFGTPINPRAPARVPGGSSSGSASAVAERIELSSHVDPAKYAAAVIRRESLTDRLVALLGNDGVLVLPTAHDLPPLRDAPVSAQIEFREKTLALTCVASLCRLPQINVPAVLVEGCPVGLSFIAGPRGDQSLLDLAEKIGSTLPVAAPGT